MLEATSVMKLIYKCVTKAFLERCKGTNNTRLEFNLKTVENISAQAAALRSLDPRAVSFGITVLPHF